MDKDENIKNRSQIDKNAAKNSKKRAKNEKFALKTNSDMTLADENVIKTVMDFKMQNKILWQSKTPVVDISRNEVSTKIISVDDDLKNKKNHPQNKGFVFKGRIMVAVVLVFVLSVFAIASVIAGTNMQSSNVITANTTNTRIVQAKLASLGYFSGQIDGIFGEETIEAIKSFQQDKNLLMTGNLDKATTVALGVTDNTQANTDLYLLAKLIYSEARGEVYEGQVAVGAVVLNRVADAGFPNTLQGVIYQPWAFTALHDGQFSLEPNGTAYQAAQDAMNGWDPTYGCLYYYNPRTATSSWIFSRQIIVTIGNHVFCV